MNKIFEKINKLTPDEIGLQYFGTLIDAFLMRHPLITDELFPALEEARMDGTYQQELDQLNVLDKTCLEDKLGGLLDLLRDAYRGIHETDDHEYVSDENRMQLFVAEGMYKRYQEHALKEGISNAIIEAYRSVSIDIKQEDKQFSKYKLISTNGFTSIYNDKDNQALFDSRLNKYLQVEVPWCLLTSIEQLISEGYIQNIAFKVRGIEDVPRLNEDWGRGTKLQLNLTELHDVSQFYDRKDPENQLWIKHDKSDGSLTFEELVSDFKLERDDIVTQVVHLEYESGPDGYVIRHLDHEYIYYSCEAYEERERNPHKRGGRKVKTFKIDDSKIPFTYKVNGEYFLYQVLDTFLKNKNLIEEYFEDMKA